MHKLVRQVRFSINPFLADAEQGDSNSFCSSPSGEGLAMFFELSVALVGELAEETGFVINVVEIDKKVREAVVPFFADRISQRYKQGRHITLDEITAMLWECHERLDGSLGKAMLSELGLMLNPLRKVEIDCEDKKMIYFSEKFEFAATHKLWNDNYSESENYEFFGKCANPAGHGHNYVIEVTIKAPQGGDNIRIGNFEQIVDSEFVNVVDHKNLNVDVDYFADEIPSVENIAVLAWKSLVGKFDPAKLYSVTVWETDKTFCTYYG